MEGTVEQRGRIIGVGLEMSDLFRVCRRTSEEHWLIPARRILTRLSPSWILLEGLYIITKLQTNKFQVV